MADSDDLQTIIKELSGAYDERSKRQSFALLLIKIVAVVLGSFIAGFAQFAALPEGELPFWNGVGMFATAIVALGGIYVVVTDVDTTDELNKARRAVEAARSLRAELQSTLFVFANLRQTTHLYFAVREMRNVIERSIYQAKVDETAAIQLCLDSAERSLKLAFDFSLQHHWTVSVYKADRKTCYPAQLTCVAHLRSVKCKIDDARSWPEGIGVTGIAYARGTEVVIPDLAAPELGSLHDITKNSKPEDGTRYRSIIGVPIVLGEKNDDKWGMVVATSDQPQHFRVGFAGADIPTTEPARAVAAMIALLLSANDLKPSQQVPPVAPPIQPPPLPPPSAPTP